MIVVVVLMIRRRKDSLKFPIYPEIFLSHSEKDPWDHHLQGAVGANSGSLGAHMTKSAWAGTSGSQ